MERIDGDYPVNSRVEIDYSGSKPKVSFEYPTKEGRDLKNESLRQHSIGWHTILIILVLGMVYSFLVSYDFGMAAPTYCDYSPNTYNASNSAYSKYLDDKFLTGDLSQAFYGFNLSCSNGNYSYVWRGKDTLLGDDIGFEEDLSLFELTLSSFVMMGFVIIGIVLNMITTRLLLKSKWYKKNFPTFMARGKNKRYMKFLPEDVENNMIIIPSFKNVVLDYNTEGDFDKYLEKVRVRELEWYEKKEGKISDKKKRNLYNWSAKFYFKKKPKKGWLEVTWQ